MKALPALILLLSLSACKVNKESSPAFGDWEIDQGVFNRITTTALPPGNPPLRAFNRNLGLLKRIERKYPPADYEYVWKKGVYGTGDAARYKSTRNRNYDVTGFETEVLQVILKSDKSDPFYFDIMFICPPPTGTCDLSDSP